MASLRNGHANRLYAAEADTFPWVPDLADEREVQAWCDKVVRSAKFKALWNEHHPKESWETPPPKRVIVKTARGTGSRTYTNVLTEHRGQWLPYIVVGERGRCRWVVLHELTHIIDPVGSHHGRAFARIYLALIRRFLPESGPLLAEQFKAHGVRYSR